MYERGRGSLRKEGKNAAETGDYRVKGTVVQPRPWIGRRELAWRGNTFEIIGVTFLAARRSVSCSWGPRSDLIIAVHRTFEQGLMPHNTGSYDVDVGGLK